MTNLFIIGNGFDLDHGMQTSYSDFREFLLTKYNISEDIISNAICEIPYPTLYPNGEEKYIDQEVVKTIIQILDATEGYFWNDIETSLGNLDYAIFLDLYAHTQNKYGHQYFVNEDCAKYLAQSLYFIGDFFQEWVLSIKIKENLDLNFENIIDKEKDFFLTFNYTKTLEKLYKPQNICHIHGTAEKIIFGHGNINNDTDYIQRYWFGAETFLNRLKRGLFKDTNQAYLDNINFFKTIEQIAKKEQVNIYSYGFSFSNVDRLYIQKICEIVKNPNSIFYLYDYDNKEQRAKFTNIIEDCGFKGLISSFNFKTVRN